MEGGPVCTLADGTQNVVGSMVDGIENISRFARRLGVGLFLGKFLWEL